MENLKRKEKKSNWERGRKLIERFLLNSNRKPGIGSEPDKKHEDSHRK